MGSDHVFRITAGARLIRGGLTENVVCPHFARKELVKRWKPELVKDMMKLKQGEHEALADIYDSIEELKYYRKAVMTILGGVRVTTRRVALVVLGAGMLAAPGTLFGQQKPKIWRVGYLTPGTPGVGPSYHDEFPRAMRELGYEEGKNLAIDRRRAEGRYERFPALASELVGKKVDVIVVSGTTAMRAVK